MWSEGIILADCGTKYKYWVKYYEEGSEFGINGGRVSKLTVRKVGEAKDLVNYDRGWDVRPKDAEVKAVYKLILKKYN